MRFKILPLVAALVFAFAGGALAFGKGGCGEGKCADCHSLSKEQAKDVLSSLNTPLEIESVELSQVPGLWDIVVKRPDGPKVLVYLDFSLKYLIQGDVLQLASKENITKSRIVELNPVDVSSIPTEDALVMGNPKAKHKIIVFDDPECPFCQKLQVAMKEVVKKRSDVAFLIKLLPLDIHPKAYEKAKTILCEKSLELLEKSLAKEDLPPASCETDQIEKNRALAIKLRVGSTPTLIFPDGRAMPGFKSADDILKALAEDKTLKPSKK